MSVLEFGRLEAETSLEDADDTLRSFHKRKTAFFGDIGNAISHAGQMLAALANGKAVSITLLSVSIACNAYDVDAAAMCDLSGKHCKQTNQEFLGIDEECGKMETILMSRPAGIKKDEMRKQAVKGEKDEARQGNRRKNIPSL